MPGRNGTGPLGQGSMTGRGFGNCNPNNVSRGVNRNHGSGYGLGKGSGRGFRQNCGWGFRKFGNWFGFGQNPNTDLSPKEEANLLKENAKAVEEELKRINQRIDELEKDSK